MQYRVNYCLVSDCRETLTLDHIYDTFGEALEAALELEEDPEVYTAWSEEVI